MADKPTSSDNADELGDLLDSSAKQFTARPHTTDDELDELMAAADQKAAQKAAGDFQKMLEQFVQVQEEAMRQQQETESKEPKAENGESSEEASMEEFVDAMKKLLTCTDKVANATNEEEFSAGLQMLRSPDNAMDPFISMIMESLVSKEIMYPPLKEIFEKYPEYLEQHKGELDPETLARYEKQYEVLGRICVEFEKQPDPSSEPPANSEEANPDEQMSNFETLGRLLMELQSHGYPPKEITGDLPNGFGLDEQTGMPTVNNVQQAAEACSIM